MRNKVTSVLLLVFFGLAFVVIKDRTGERSAPDQNYQDRGCATVDCGELQGMPAGRVVLSQAEACGDVGYLCADLEERQSLQILRLPSNTQRITVRIPLPPGEDPTAARALQSAAWRGIMKWDGKPFRIVTDTRPRSEEPADIVIRWSRSLGGNQLGVTSRVEHREGSRAWMSVSGLALATHSPRNFEQELSADQVMLTAAHEMGHALGLPHSDDSKDVMFPTNTARALTNRDYRTLVALYDTPNGAEIRRD